ncbi:hypothetical protein EBT25_05220 [bacterium]|nr:hypothetical protein [bacterium]
MNEQSDAELEYEQFRERMENNFPGMFSQPYGGFDVGKGWWLLIETLCERIASHTRQTNRNTKVIDEVIVDQIKEKFGGLRFYYHGGDQYIAGLVEMAESMSYFTCEQCGGRGKRRSTGWIRTLCDTHAPRTYSIAETEEGD